MFERFTARARKTGVLAQEKALRLGHGYLGAEHLLLGHLREEEGVAACVLISLVSPSIERVSKSIIWSVSVRKGRWSGAVRSMCQEGLRARPERSCPDQAQLHRHRAHFA